MEPSYKADYENSRILKFDRNLIPEEFRVLEILIRRWSLTDAADLENEIGSASHDDLKSLSEEVSRLYGDLLDWLADKNVQTSYNASYDAFSDTYEALTLLIMACDLADIRLEQGLNSE
jgi:hypothetical protein